jgi:hypothetical protein
MDFKLSDLPSHLPELALSYGLEALIAAKVEENQGALTAEGLAQCALRLYPEKVVQKNLENLSVRFVNRVERLAKAKGLDPLSKPDSIKETSKPKRTLGANLEEWTQSLDPTGICLYLADYDPERAHHLYWWVDSDLLELTLKSKLGFAAVLHSCNFEATMYGFGGKYSDDEEQQSENTVSGELDAGALSAFGINF